MEPQAQALLLPSRRPRAAATLIFGEDPAELEDYLEPLSSNVLADMPSSRVHYHRSPVVEQDPPPLPTTHAPAATKTSSNPDEAEPSEDFITFEQVNRSITFLRPLYPRTVLQTDAYFMGLEPKKLRHLVILIESILSQSGIPFAPPPWLDIDIDMDAEDVDPPRQDLYPDRDGSHNGWNARVDDDHAHDSAANELIGSVLAPQNPQTPPRNQTEHPIQHRLVHPPPPRENALQPAIRPPATERPARTEDHRDHMYDTRSPRLDAQPPFPQLQFRPFSCLIRCLRCGERHDSRTCIVTGNGFMFRDPWGICTDKDGRRFCFPFNLPNGCRNQRCGYMHRCTLCPMFGHNSQTCPNVREGETGHLEHSNGPHR